MKSCLSAPYALHSGDGQSSHGTEWSEAGVHCLMLHLVQLGVVGGYHDSARPTPTLTTPQFRAAEVHWGRSRSSRANMPVPGGARVGLGTEDTFDPQEIQQRHFRVGMVHANL